MGVSWSESPWLILSCGSRLEGGLSTSDDLGSKLTRSLEEAQRVLPSHRIVVVGLESESPWWASRVAHLAQGNVIEQPIDRGSAMGVLIAFLHILRRDPGAEVIIASVDAHPGAIVAAEAHAAVRDEGQVLVALRSGGLIGVCRASSSVLLRLFRDASPGLVSTVSDHLMREGEGTLDVLYPFLPAVDLERDVFGLVPARPRSAPVAIAAHARAVTPSAHRHRFSMSESA